MSRQVFWLVFAKIVTKERRTAMKSINHKRFAALALCLLFCFAMAFSVFFLVAEAHHHCTGADCPICAEMHVCTNLLHSAGLSVTGTAILAALCFFISLLLFTYDAGCNPYTLVSLKVKLSN